jgi:hypothetical protein
MPPTGETYFARPDRGGLMRDPATLHTHLMPGAADVDLLRAALDLDVSAERSGDEITVHVTVTNAFGGHHVPTDSPLRHIIAVVSAVGPDGEALPHIAGPTVPDWCGVGDGERRYGGMPGTVFAKVLEELWTGVTPTGAYWNPTIVVSDTRIPALASDETVYRFTASAPAHIDVKLIFRRAPIDLIDQKSWDSPDIEMASATVTVP